MALKEVKRFMNYIKENRKALETYNEKLLESGSFIFTEPTVVSTGYYVSPMLPENLEDDLLERIIQLDETSARKLEKISESRGQKISLKDRIVTKFDAIMFNGETPKEHILTHEEMKRHKLFDRLADLARDDGFDISTEDLLYFIGKAVEVIMAEHPEYNDIQIIDAVLNSFE